MENTWVRTCQECGHKQISAKPNPDAELTDAYRNKKCRRCKSSGLDYGTEMTKEEIDAASNT